MKQTLFITGTDTGAGKTVLTALLAQFLRARGLRVAALKPLCSGGRDDALMLFTALEGELTLDEINPWHFQVALAPLLAARRENKTVRLAEVVRHIRSVGKNYDITLVEGAGGLLSPLGVCSGGLRPSQSSAFTERRYKESFNSRDLIVALKAAPIIVAQNKLGVVNHVLLTLEALPRNLRSKAKIVFMSPAKADSATASNPTLLAQLHPAERIFMLPWLGKIFSPHAALKKTAVRRTLAQLAD